jgi:hypothetical protein
MERAIELFASITFIVIGCSHVVQPRGWAEFFVLLRSLGTAGSFFNGLLTLSVGALIVSFHNVWSGIPLILTVVGWAQVLKGVLGAGVDVPGRRSGVRPHRRSAGMAPDRLVLTAVSLTPCACRAWAGPVCRSLPPGRSSTSSRAGRRASR